MLVLHECTAGIDVHRKVAVVSIAMKDQNAKTVFDTREYPTFRADLKRMAEWIKSRGVSLSIMEGTGVYWKSVYEVLEDTEVPTILVNARHVKNVPGRKTDVLDSQWLAELGMHGLLRASFIPCLDIRDLRMLTRYRCRLVGMLASEKNRLNKTLDECGVRLGCVVSDIDGVSARAMITKLIDGQLEPRDLAKLARGRLRKKIPDLERSLDGRISDRHRYLLRQITNHIDAIKLMLVDIDAQVVAAMQPYKKQWNLIQTVPGFDEISAAMLLAEIGPDMSVFKTKDRLSSWAGLCPGNNESAGKKSLVAYEKAIRM